MKRLILILSVMLILQTASFADLDTASIEDAVPDSAKETVGSIDEVADVRSFFVRLEDAAVKTLREIFSPILGKAVSVVIIALICSMLGVFSEAEIPQYLSMCGCFAISLICVSDSNAYISQCSEAIGSISLFSKTLLPALCTLSAACGEISASAVRYAGTALFMNVFISIAESVIVPLVYAFLAVSIAAAAFNNKILEGIGGLIKSVTKILMTVLALSFTLYLGVSNAIASSGDAVATKLAKTAISTVLPVVGGMISDAASSVVAGAELLKTTVGAFGMISVLSICLVPLLTLGLNFIVFKAAAVGVSAFGAGRLSALTSSIGSAFGMLLGLVGCCGIMMFISIISCMRAVVS